MSKVRDYSDVVSLLPLNWEAGDEAFQFVLDEHVDWIVRDLSFSGLQLDKANIAALHEAAWVHRDKVKARRR